MDLDRPSSAGTLALGQVEVDLSRRQVLHEGGATPLTALEARLLHYLAGHAGADVAREELLIEVWGYAPSANTRAVDFAVKRLRSKLGEAGRSHLLTVHGVGYRLALGPAAPAAVQPPGRAPILLANGELDLERCRFSPTGGAAVVVSGKEAELLELLAQTSEFVPREVVERALWRAASPNVYLALVQRVRRKLGDGLEVHRGLGLRLVRLARPDTLPRCTDRFVDRVERERALAALARARVVTLKGPALSLIHI